MTDTDLQNAAHRAGVGDLQSVTALYAEASRARMCEKALLAERDSLPRAPGLLTPERMAEIRASMARHAAEWGESDEASVYKDRRDLLTHADTMEGLLRDLGGDPLAIREAERARILALADTAIKRYDADAKVLIGDDRAYANGCADSLRVLIEAIEGHAVSFAFVSAEATA